MTKTITRKMIGTITKVRNVIRRRDPFRASELSRFCATGTDDYCIDKKTGIGLHSKYRHAWAGRSRRRHGVRARSCKE